MSTENKKMKRCFRMSRRRRGTYRKGMSMLLTICMIITLLPSYSLAAMSKSKRDICEENDDASTASDSEADYFEEIFDDITYEINIIGVTWETDRDYDEEAENAQAVAAAKTTIEEGIYIIAQADASTRDNLKTALSRKINSLNGMSGTGITVTASDIIIRNFKQAITGDVRNPDGTSGSFSFTVALSRGEASGTTTSREGVIIAVAFTNPDDVDKDGYYDGDVAAINAMIVNNNLSAVPDDPEGWGSSGFVSWNRENPSRITKLYLNNNSLAGTLDVSSLKSLTRLDRLDCNYNQLTRLTGLSNLTQLTRLECVNNRLEEISGLEGMINLTHLYCYNNQLVMLDVSNLTNLTYMDCSFNPLASLKLSDTSKLTVNGAAGGRVQLIQYLNNKSVTLQAFPDNSHTFREWAVDGMIPPDVSANPFTFPLDDIITITPLFESPEDAENIQSVAAAKIAIESSTYTVAQADAGDEAALKSALAAQIGVLSGMNGTGINVTENNITIADFKQAIAGNADAPDGVNGSFSFTVALVKGASSDTAGRDGIIKATAYTNPAPDVYRITVSGSYAAETGGGEYAAGTRVIIQAGNRADYRFLGWTSEDEVCFDHAASSTTFIIMPGKPVTVTANWSYIGGSSGSGGSGGGSGSSPSAGGTISSTTTNTRSTETGGSVTTVQTTTTDSSGKKTTVTTDVTRDANGNVTESIATVTTDYVVTTTGEGSSHITVKPDAAAINSAAAIAGVTLENPLEALIEIPLEPVSRDLQKSENNTVTVEVITPTPAAGRPSIGFGISIGEEIVQTIKDLGKDLTVTIRNENGTVQAVWFFDGQVMKNRSEQADRINLVLHTASVQSDDPFAQPVKPLAEAQGSQNGLVININGSGELPLLTLTVPATEQTGIKADDSVILYRYDRAANTLIPVPGGMYMVDSDGNATVHLPIKKIDAGPDCFVLLPIPLVDSGLHKE